MILLSTNCSTLNASKLRALGSRHVSESVTFHASAELPDIPAEHGAATIWMRING
jgi:hypothetical protein